MILKDVACNPFFGFLASKTMSTDNIACCTANCTTTLKQGTLPKASLVTVSLSNQSVVPCITVNLTCYFINTWYYSCLIFRTIHILLGGIPKALYFYYGFKLHLLYKIFIHHQWFFSSYLLSCFQDNKFYSIILFYVNMWLEK